MNVERLSHLCQGQVCAIPLERIGGVGSRLPLTLLLEGGIPGSSLEEIEKRFLQVTQGLLQGNRRHLREPAVFLLLLEVRQGFREVFRGEALLLLVECVGLLTQGPVVDETSATKGASKNMFLLSSGVKPVLVCSFLFHVYIVAYYDVKVKQGYPTTLLQTRNAKDIVPSGNSLVQSL
jgi:hypothetical protein